jgi:hypothetical protein
MVANQEDDGKGSRFNQVLAQYSTPPGLFSVDLKLHNFSFR